MQEVLRVVGIVKHFPGVVAVDHVGFTVRKGEVMALLGENGAGKSTITKIICGAEKPDSGKIIINGEECVFNSAHEAMQKGISMVYQELSMVGNMSVAENIFMNRQPVNQLGGIDWKKLYRDTEALLRKFEINVSPDTLVKELSVGTQQLMEILKAISSNPKLLILDEPTSSLTEKETEMMYRVIRTLKRDGCALIYISHKLSEVFDIADSVVVMRDGKYAGDGSVESITENDIIRMMVGREISNVYGCRDKPLDENSPYVFCVEGLTTDTLYQDVCFGVRKGEILGVSGLIGAGRSEMALGIIGAHKVDHGRISLNGTSLKIHNPSAAIHAKIAYLTEDRKKNGLYLNASIQDNLAATMLKRFTRRGIIRTNKMKGHAARQIQQYRIITPSALQKINKLSGGNQQKCLISMWMGTNPDVIIFDEPTRGVDVGARSEIYKIIRNYASKGKCIIIISSELPELMGISDRILVMRNGSISGQLSKDEFNEEKIMQYATGMTKEKE